MPVLTALVSVHLAFVHPAATVILRVADRRVAGPSPHTRGNRVCEPAGLRQQGSIPAHAGQPATPFGNGVRRRVHPRTGGATGYRGRGLFGNQGPSPHTRGNRLRAVEPPGGAGSIPAHAGQPAAVGARLTARRVHPRTRGATHRVAISGRYDAGPSPHTRGNRRRGCRAQLRERSIPAHAGQPMPGRRWCRVARVHPRTRGATRLARGESVSRQGPSPHTRGNPLLGMDGTLDRGSIPAHAGQPRAVRSSRSSSRVHPRTRGATPLPAHGGILLEGPSPHTRGNREHARDLQGERGSIPAHAGQPRSPTIARITSRVHPRTRGATRCLTAPGGRSSGPSPHTRGNPHLLGRAVGFHGSIPAHAGQPRSPTIARITSRVHPRTRGATPPSAVARAASSGPSPHTRGNPGRRQRCAPTRGSIPAHAGQPASRLGRAWSSRVHPRTRGATPVSESPAERIAGPSPHTRGNPVTHGRRAGGRGSIPAHAGQPVTAALSGPASRVHPRTRGATVSTPAAPRSASGPSPHTRGNPRGGVHGVTGTGSIPAHAGQPRRARVARRRLRVHPRTRGATQRPAFATARNWGPSPHTRGNPERAQADA